MNKKKKTKISDAELRLILLLLAIILLAVAYFVGYNRLVTMSTEIESQNDIDRATVQKLESMVSRRQQVEEETETLRQNIQDIIAQYPSDLTTEKVICTIQDMEDYSGAEISNISFLMRNALMTFAATEGTTGLPPIGYYSTMSMNYTATYDNFKQMVLYINSLTKDRSTIPAISATYDQDTDMLTGVITVNMYYLTGTDREYVAPQPGYYPKGVDSIFGAGDGIVQNEEEAGEEGEAAAE